jgi:hypothetical protein
MNQIQLLEEATGLRWLRGSDRDLPLRVRIEDVVFMVLPHQSQDGLGWSLEALATDGSGAVYEKIVFPGYSLERGAERGAERGTDRDMAQVMFWVAWGRILASIH